MLYCDTELTKEQVQARLTAELAGRARGGFPARDFAKEALVEDRHRPVAYVNGGRWVADCLCSGGIACWPGAQEVACLDCGRIYRTVDYPSKAQVDRADALLSERHSPFQRNWNRHQGETLADIQAENKLIERSDRDRLDST
jgi:hypothetical protein